MVKWNSVSLVLLSLLFTVHASGDIIQGRQAITGDKKCSSFMCVSATVNGSNVEYVLSSTGKSPLGWMGMGFGRQMANTPMVIMWANSDGNVTISQRRAPAEVMPTVDPNPPRVATLANYLTSVSGSTSSFGYTIPANGDTKQFVIFAFSTEAPSSSASDADLVQHTDFNQVQLDLTKSSSTSTSPGAKPAPTGGSGSDNAPSDDIPLLPYQRLIVSHAIFCVLGFMLFLPAGALLARYLRTFTPAWFIGHWMAQFAIAGPAIIIGIALGIRSVTKAGALHLNDTHKKLGIALFVLYIVQCGLGAIVHWVKPKNQTRRPIQNYAHAGLGLLIIALAMYQVRVGYKIEWPKTTGREHFPNSVDIVFYIWIVLIPVLYFAGLAFLPKQFKQESIHRQGKVPTEEQDLDTPGDLYRDQE